MGVEVVRSMYAACEGIADDIVLATDGAAPTGCVEIISAVPKNINNLSYAKSGLI